MNKHEKSWVEFDEDAFKDESDQLRFEEVVANGPKRSPMRRKDKQRKSGLQPKSKRNQKKLLSRLKYDYEW